jgi:hypothetical protein
MASCDGTAVLVDRGEVGRNHRGANASALTSVLPLGGRAAATGPAKEVGTVARERRCGERHIRERRAAVLDEPVKPADRRPLATPAVRLADEQGQVVMFDAVGLGWFGQ